ncbi:DUF1697 domain-containing protein [Rhodobacter ferrooxidans]|uniref:DUF1697 domain-containing protein n=1 Tax=Rhodobacter ferrooxidans TaxID=371731 RepID=C8S0V8_9RHOB|nr:DUF1697 domain-containing protein [Rhodobacter sp. SW2]EEW25399.1 protein of unknown function DUF1697 [Rhodobacter sp. SW2]
MTVWVCLLRGVNVGGANRLPMPEFRALLADLGLPGAVSHIQSGNAVFRAAEAPEVLAARISHGLARRFGIATPVLLRSLAQIEAALAANPFPEAAPTALHFFFLGNGLSDDLQVSLQARAVDGETLVVANDLAWLHAPVGIGRSRLAEALGRLKLPVTARNLRTVQALAKIARTLP